VFAFSDEDYGEQKSVKAFTQQMCDLPQPIPFDVYFTKNDCESYKKKSQYNTCQLSDITNDYMAEMKKETPKKESPKQSTEKSVYKNSVKLSMDQIKSYWPNYIRFKDVDYKDKPEMLYETLVQRIQKKEPTALIEIKG
jgi:hypothetical protein